MSFVHRPLCQNWPTKAAPVVADEDDDDDGDKEAEAALRVPIPRPSSMEDDLEDRIFYQTYVSHVKLLSKFLLGSGSGAGASAFTSSLGSSTAMAYLWRLCRVYLVRPEVLLGAMVIFLLMVYMQAVEVWTRGFVDRVWQTTRPSRAARKIDLTMASPAEKHSWEMVRQVSAVYSIKGRRATMEDR